MFLHFKLDSNTSFTQSIPSDWNSFAYILQGEGVFGDVENEVKGIELDTLIFSHGDYLKFANKSNFQLNFILLAGKPINEPIVRNGPYVMNCNEDLSKAFEDYYYGINGFELTKRWNF